MPPQVLVLYLYLSPAWLLLARFRFLSQRWGQLLLVQSLFLFVQFLFWSPGQLSPVLFPDPVSAPFSGSLNFLPGAVSDPIPAPVSGSASANSDPVPAPAFGSADVCQESDPVPVPWLADILPVAVIKLANSSPGPKLVALPEAAIASLVPVSQLTGTTTVPIPGSAEIP
ncbi:hypothetical protein EXN66_Car020473 [Channa argus]|uniref:Uncharacterized protein n=1 Tax=Channa argus TaxID=215402 RepID=A0A6G1QR60_CHAAH|nr:hypothetical protein EXN66_Car020473 [Channa argus]KAK2885166.1 hypothetical protein Q8A73_021640 [Channa argus]